MAERRVCAECGRSIKGRPDKKFCDHECRNNYNNNLRKRDPLVRSINNALGKNRRILQSILPKNQAPIKISKQRLLDLGFNFTYMTHQYITQNSKTYSFCYEYGYLSIETDLYLIVRGQKFL
jgi:hypothetical protein